MRGQRYWLPKSERQSDLGANKGGEKKSGTKYNVIFKKNLLMSLFPRIEKGRLIKS